MNLWGALPVQDDIHPCSYLGTDSSGNIVVDPPIPVTFGVPYTLTMSGFDECIEGEDNLCGTVSTYVSNLTFTDANGNPLTGLTLVPYPAPEATSGLLLLTCILGIALVRVWRRNSVDSRQRRVLVCVDVA